jgi:peptidyl-prolyl cis-trans isomerase C
VIKLEEKRLKDAPPLAEVQAELETQIRQAKVEKLVDETTAAAQIDQSASEGIDPAILTNIDLLE